MQSMRDAKFGLSAAREFAAQRRRLFASFLPKIARRARSTNQTTIDDLRRGPPRA